MTQAKLLRELLTQYALEGVSDWKETDNNTQRRARVRLQHNIVEDEWTARVQIKKLHSQASMQFMPMPKHRNEGVGSFFFISRNIGDDGERKLSFELFCLVNEENSLAFRFEPADQEGHAHNYAHVQFCRTMMGKGISPDGIPSWLPDSYPAFPLPSSDPLKLFLAMLTAVHGRFGGIEQVLQEIFQKANQTGKVKEYTKLLKEMLDG